MASIEWDKWKKWNMLCIPVIGDGNCLFHCLLYVLYDDYKISSNRDKVKLSKRLRSALAKKLYHKSESNPELCEYELLGNGNYANFTKESNIAEFSIRTMYHNIKTDKNYLGYGYIEHLSKQLKTDIYILWKNKQDIYPFIKDEVYIANTKSIILIYDDNIQHYEVAGVFENGKVTTLFSPDHPLILHIRDRLLSSSL